MTHTYALLEVSPGTYAEIRAKLEAAGYEHALHPPRWCLRHDVLDMHGLAIVAGPLVQSAPSLSPEHEVAAEAIRLRDQQIGAIRRACELDLERALGYASGSIASWQEMLDKVRETIAQRNEARSEVEEFSSGICGDICRQWKAAAAAGAHGVYWLYDDVNPETVPRAVRRAVLKEAADALLAMSAPGYRHPPTIPGDGGKPGSGETEPRAQAMQEGAATPGQEATAQGAVQAAGDVAEPQLDPTPDRVEHPPSHGTIPHPEKYTYRVTWSEEDQEHVGLCVEFPSLSWLAATHGEALNGIIGLVVDVIKDMAKSKEPIPEPLSLRLALRVPPEQHRELAMERGRAGDDDLGEAYLALRTSGGVYTTPRAGSPPSITCTPRAPHDAPTPTYKTTDAALYDVAMVRGLARAACLLEDDPYARGTDGELWDDESREALKLARKIGLSPPATQRAQRTGDPDPFARSAMVIEYTLTEAEARRPDRRHKHPPGEVAFRLRVISNNGWQPESFIRQQNELGEFTWVKLNPDGMGAMFEIGDVTVDHNFVVSQAIRRLASRLSYIGGIKVTVTTRASKFDLNPE